MEEVRPYQRAKLRFNSVQLRTSNVQKLAQTAAKVQSVAFPPCKLKSQNLRVRSLNANAR